MTDALTWIVPGRRAVVRSSGIDYKSLIAAWCQALEQHQQALCRWYEISDVEIEIGLADIRQWAASFFFDDGDIFAPRDGEVTIDSPPFHFMVRLWKGPLRVLLEAQAASEEPGEVIYNPLQTEEPRLMLHEATGEVLNQDAPFLMGDVVEFPLFKFLASCGLSEYGNWPSYEDQLHFNGQGSYLLGTSLADCSGFSPPVAVKLHDNLIAMRFQMLIHTFVGSFYHLDEPVFTEGTQGPQAQSGDHTVYSRGMIYAGVFYAPGKQPDHWWFYANRWCADKNGELPRCLPALEGLHRLSPQFPVTPGSVCSDTTLFLLNYMIDHHSKNNWGIGSVGGTMKKMKDAAIQKAYNFWPKDKIAELVPEVDTEELETQLDDLMELLKPVMEMLDSEKHFIIKALNEIEKKSGWETNVSQKWRQKLRKSPASLPLTFMNNLGSAIKSKKTLEAGKTLLCQLHRDVVLKAIKFRTHFEAVLACKGWTSFAHVGTDFSQNKYQQAITKLRNLSACEGKCSLNHEFDSFFQLRYGLQYKYPKLKKLHELPPEERQKKLGGNNKIRSGLVDLSEHLGDINNVSLNGHEWGIVRVHDYDRLLNSEQLPMTGFVAAYHPLSGESYFSKNDPALGQFYIFEQGSSLKRHTLSSGKKHTLFGCAPFKWQKINGNQFALRVQKTGSSSIVNIGTNGKLREKQQLLSITRLCQPEDGRDFLAEAYGEVPDQGFLPLYVYPVDGADEQEKVKKAKKRMATNGYLMFYSRAVPLPSMREVEGGFASYAQVEKSLSQLLNHLKGKS